MRSLAAVLLSRPKEVTMKARSEKLAGPWKISADRAGATAISLFADDGFAALQGTDSVRSTDQTEERPNG